MKCEICKKATATEVLSREDAGEDGELYVCSACARTERARRKAKSQKTRRMLGLPPGVSMSITEVGVDGEGSPDAAPILGALMNAMKDFVSSLEPSEHQMKASSADEHVASEVITAESVESAYRVKNAFHLEGLCLIGEIDAVRRALHALEMDLEGFSADGINETGHIYRIRYRCEAERAKRVVKDILREERNARRRLREDFARVFEDAVCRALAILKNCRLLSKGEFFDLLSPLRLAAKEKLLDGLTFSQVDRMMNAIDISDTGDLLTQEENDRVDGERADVMNKRFEEVMLNEVL